jgi:hypothetical protein
LRRRRCRSADGAWRRAEPRCPQARVVAHSAQVAGPRRRVDQRAP